MGVHSVDDIRRERARLRRALWANDRRPPVHRCVDDGPTHAYQFTGLDTVDGALSNTRRCVWCGQREHTPYGGRGAWEVRSGGGGRET